MQHQGELTAQLPGDSQGSPAPDHVVLAQEFKPVYAQFGGGWLAWQGHAIGGGARQALQDRGVVERPEAHTHP